VNSGNNNNRFLHFVALGRPEVFREWLRATHRPRVPQIWPLRLSGADLVTKGDLNWWSKNALKYAIFPEEPNEEKINQFSNAVLNNPFLSYSITVPAQANYLAEQISVSSASEDIKPEELRNNIFQSLLTRNNSTHGRPDTRLGQSPILYKKLLMEVAAKYAGSVNDQGFFIVNADDTVSAKDPISGKTQTVYVSHLLDRSGLIDMDPTGFALLYYRFEPFWVHSHLLELRKQEQDNNYKYQTCS